MTRKMIDCRVIPNEVGCTLAISGEPEEVLTAAARHAVDVHGHTASSELREQLRGALADDTPSSAGAFVQLIEFESDRPTEWDGIVSRWEAAIGSARTARWSLVGVDRDHPGRHVAVVEFPSYDEAMVNSGHPATDKFLAELRTICTSEPTFRNLDVQLARPA